MRYALGPPLLGVLLALPLGAPARGAPPAPAQVPAALLRSIYFHVKDSTGKTAAQDTDAVLFFEPDGHANLYIAKDSAGLAFAGHYTFAGGQLSLTFKGADFHPDVKLAFDPEKAAQTLPFNVFSTEVGTSSWRREDLAPAQALQLVFNASMMSEDHLSVPAALDRALAYAQTLVAPPAATAPAAPPPPPLPVRVDKIANGIKLVYKDGPPLTVLLFSWGKNDDPGATPPLSITALTTDPRVHLDPKLPADGVSDPPRKTALFVAPFNTRRVFGWVNAIKMVFDPDHSDGVLAPGSVNCDYNGMQTLLERAGYKVKQLLDGDASLTRLVDELLESPSFLVFNTHGGSDGNLTVGDDLGVDATKYGARLADVVKDAQKKYPDLPAGQVVAVGVSDSLRPGKITHYFDAIEPPFWAWLRFRKGKQADFSSSFVYIAACDTEDQGPALADNIGARAHLAWKGHVTPELAGAVFQYLVRHLFRPTHSAEEAYYNLVRVGNLRQMIYTEDKLLDGLVPRMKFQELLHGYWGTPAKGGGIAMTSYLSAGWMGTPKTADPGNIWYLVFSGRWGTNDTGVAQGIANHLACNKFWKQHKPCEGDRQRAPGAAPTQDEVAYALYLLGGKAPLPFSGKLASRWTLDDAQAARLPPPTPVGHPRPPL